ncbi:AraC family transcriptional regulator [Tropicimonas marinistellae]|uniref:AraC family transcriptional regulator n=1 Tax=Tropicimonas marinistellae TaxID=1739787 RepID=UPI00083172FE|nr:AraC family transcriptional regulator [Tropicimonas marinistellae]
MNSEAHGYAAIRGALLVAVLDRLIARSVAVHPLLAKHGLSLETLRDPYVYLSLLEYVGFLEDAADLSGDTHIGARIGTDIRAGDLGPIGLLLSLSRSIYVGIDRMVRSAAALQTGTDIALLEDGKDVVWSYRLIEGRIWPRRQDAEFSAVATVQVIRNNFLRRWRPTQVHFEHVAHGDPQFLERYFGCPVIFGQATNRIIMDRGPLVELHRREDTALISVLERHVADLIDATPDRSNLSKAARSVISSGLGLRAVSVERVADTLGLSPRNLQRKLAEEGTSVRDLLDDIRRHRAEELLSEGNIPIGEIANALGYADGTAFWRAHKRWSELTPREIKAAARTDVPRSS